MVLKPEVSCSLQPHNYQKHCKISATIILKDNLQKVIFDLSILNTTTNLEVCVGVWVCLRARTCV